ncbi:hypothetical protein BKA70DRAFT_1400604 [Coprinopsis sp. MPI-PUGE-AT-0042]|nr:hypothetical protein BKA70DRAFT_1400604 [Coprinopsis sp. MPI-PUGE-AT-0042]
MAHPGKVSNPPSGLPISPVPAVARIEGAATWNDWMSEVHESSSSGGGARDEHEDEDGRVEVETMGVLTLHVCLDLASARDGMGWDGMGWDGMGWDGMGWDGMGWDGMGWRMRQRERVWAVEIPLGLAEKAGEGRKVESDVDRGSFPFAWWSRLWCLLHSLQLDLLDILLHDRLHLSLCPYRGGVGRAGGTLTCEGSFHGSTLASFFETPVRNLTTFILEPIAGVLEHSVEGERCFAPMSSKALVHSQSRKLVVLGDRVCLSDKTEDDNFRAWISRMMVKSQRGGAVVRMRNTSRRSWPCFNKGDHNLASIVAKRITNFTRLPPTLLVQKSSHFSGRT